MFRRRNVPSINSVYEAISQPHLLQTTIQFIFKYQTSFSRLFLAWWSSDDVLTSDWSAWPHAALWLAAGHWPQCSWSLGLMSALSAPEDVKLVQISSSSYQEHRHERRHKNGTGAILREIEHWPVCRQMWCREWYEYDDQSRCALLGAALGTNFMKSRQQWQRHSSPHWQAVKIIY